MQDQVLPLHLTPEVIMSAGVRRIRASLAILVLASAMPLLAQPSGKQVILLPGGRGGGMLSPGIRVGDLVFSSGQLGAAADSTIETQATSALNSVKGVFEAAGTNMDNAVKCTVFLVDVKDFAKMNEAYAKFFPGDKGPPARSTVVVAALVRATAKVEIECIAAMPR
jgi:2-iminobutanoate/2-iminopropanoate deaminase